MTEVAWCHYAKCRLPTEGNKTKNYKPNTSG